VQDAGLVEGDLAETHELDLKLVSGPAQSPTVNLSRADRAEIMARVAAARATVPAPAAQAGACCDSPLAAKARSERWKFCPACGKPIAG
jgi:hypothetical protein